jgi:two-component system copper resistance phosphate regulon response regulator CusR
MVTSETKCLLPQKFMQILVVEEEVRLARQIASALTEAGHDSVMVHDGKSALDRAVESSFDLIILDARLPAMAAMDGVELLRRLGSEHNASRVLVLTLRGELRDRMAGLQLGANDYLSKPFAIPELVARVRALGRRCAEKPALNLQLADLAFDLVDHRVYRGGRRIELTPRELTLLKVFMHEPGRVFTRTELSERVWEHKPEYNTKLVEVFIGRLRKKLGDPQLIHTVRRVGYTISVPDCKGGCRSRSL